MFALPLVIESVLLGRVTPRLEASLVEHLGEEKIDRHRFVLLEIELFKCSAGHFLEHFVLKSDLCNAILGHQLLNRHDFVEFQANSGHKLGSHDTVEHLVEVDKPIVNVDTHLQNNPIDFFLPSDLVDANPRLHPGRQRLEELWNLLGLHLDARVLIRKLGPGLFEAFKVYIKLFERAIRIQVILLELLDDDKNEEIQHDVGNDHVESQEEKWSDTSATSFIRNAFSRSVHRVIHDSVPILTCRDREEK